MRKRGVAMGRGHSRRFVPIVAALGVVTLAGAGCGGSRLPHDEIVAAANGAVASSGSAGPAGTSSGGGGTSLGAGPSSPQSTANGTSAGANGTTAVRPGQPSAGGSTGSAGGATGQATADHSLIVIGTASNETGPAGAAEADGPQALVVWAQWINAKGGINGHPIKVVNEDDGSDPARQASDVQDMVENQHIVALVDQWAALSQSGSVSYIDQHHIPVVGGDLSSNNGWGTSPYFFPQATVADNAYKGLTYQVAAAALPQGKKNLGTLVCVEAPTCGIGQKDFEKFGPQAGFNVVYNGQASIANPDYTAECLQAQQKGVQVLWAGFDLGSVKRVAQSCARQGFNPTFIVTQAVSNASFATIPAFDGSIGATLTFPFLGTSSPAIDEYYAAFQKYASDAVLSPISASGWAAAKLFEKVASMIKGPVTSATIAATLWTLRNETLGGLTIPLTFLANQPTNPPPCVFPIAITGGKWVAPNGDNDVCY